MLAAPGARFVLFSQDGGCGFFLLAPSRGSAAPAPCIPHGLQFPCGSLVAAQRGQGSSDTASTPTATQPPREHLRDPAWAAHPGTRFLLGCRPVRDNFQPGTRKRLGFAARFMDVSPQHPAEGGGWFGAACFEGLLHKVPACHPARRVTPRSPVPSATAARVTSGTSLGADLLPPGQHPRVAGRVTSRCR